MFSDTDGQRRMDLFDFGCYFGSHVPVQARNHALLKHSVCAYAAKQLFQASTQKAIVGGITSRQATMEIYDEPVEWELEASLHYGHAVSILQELVAAATNSSDAEGSEGYWDNLEPSEYMDLSDAEQLRSQAPTPKMRLQEDEVVAASTILGVYEFVSATGPAWSRHLNGTKLLLDIAGPKMTPLSGIDPDAMAIAPDLVLSEGRKAAFWQLARQDYLASCKSRRRQRLLPLLNSIQSSMNAERDWTPRILSCGSGMACPSIRMGMWSPIVPSQFKACRSACLQMPLSGFLPRSVISSR